MVIKARQVLHSLISMLVVMSTAAEDPGETDYVVLKWSSYPDHKYINEYFLRGKDALYVVRVGDADDEIPKWLASEVDEDSKEAIETLLDALINGSKERLVIAKQDDRRCHFGYQWGVKISENNGSRIYGSKCDSPEVQVVMNKIMEASFGVQAVNKIAKHLE